jgi:hypothetical protein
MENSIRLERVIRIYDVEFNEVQYEVQVVGGMIEGIFRSDGKEMERKEREDLRDFIYENNVK